MYVGFGCNLINERLRVVNAAENLAEISPAAEPIHSSIIETSCAAKFQVYFRWPELPRPMKNAVGCLASGFAFG